MQERLHKYEVELSKEQRFILQQLIAKGNAPVRKLAHARILLKIDRHAPGPRWTDEPLHRDPHSRARCSQRVR